MPEFTPQELVFIFGVVALTAIAVFTDVRLLKIPNWLTLPAFGLGWVYQITFHGFAGFFDGGLGFLVGFGTFFALWMVGSGGGGDTKLMGALSVWLGFVLTLWVMAITVFVVIAGTALMFFISLMKRGMRSTIRDMKSARGDQRVTKGDLNRMMRVGQAMPYAVSIALASWLVLFLDAHGIKGGQLKSHTVKAVEAATQKVSQR